VGENSALHPWHDISCVGPSEDDVRAVIETPHDSRVQYAIDGDTGILRVRRVLFSAVHFPANYGFVPRTLAPDDEALDILVLGQEPIAPMSILHARPIGALRMLQNGVRDDKLISVHTHDPMFAHYRRVDELPHYRMAEIERFFDDYRALERITGRTQGFGDVEEARVLLRDSRVRYEARYANAAR
jgi:inorganic pyrophosphatase